MGEKHGKLKIFLGYAAGVGKTYAMLVAAQQLKSKGEDVVVGYIEPHQRPDTLALCEGLESIPPRQVFYKGLSLFELDLVAIIDRSPNVVIVDEFAHTNCPKCRHLKRYQDIEEILNHGIDVYTTINIQHIESLNDIVESITGIAVSERVPDRLIDMADTIELIDIDPVELIERIKAGKVYSEEQASRALSNFFKEEILVSLREISLRKTADKVTKRRNKEFGYRDGTLAIKDHILVCISPAPSNAKVIRNAARMVEAFHAEFTAVYVIDEDVDYDDLINQGLRENIRLAEDLGAVVSPLYGSNVSQQIANYATLSKVTKIVLGRTTNYHLKSVFSKPLVERLIEYTSGIDIYVIPDNGNNNYGKVTHDNRRYNLNYKEWVVMIAFILVATLISVFFYSMGFSEANIITVYIMSVLFTSIIVPNKIIGAISSVVSVLLFNFLFTEPRFSLNAYDSGYPVTFLIMFAATYITSSLAVKLKIQDKKHVKESYQTKILLDTSLKLQSANSQEEIIFEMGNQIKQLLDKSVILYTQIMDELVPTVFSDEDQSFVHDTLLSKEEVAIANWVYQNNRRAGATTRTLSNALSIYYAIRSHGQVVGVMGVYITDSWDVEEKNLVLLILNELGLALEAQKLNEQHANSQRQVQEEKLRSNILRTISHDLRTPLTSISGNAHNLLTHPIKDSQRREITKDILDDALWLTNLVENILAMTRFDKEGPLLNCELEVFDDIAEEAVRLIKERTDSTHLISIIPAETVSLVNVDAKLMLQVMINLIDNAIKYTPKGTEIRVEILDEDDSITVKVIDEGKGIPQEVKSKLFEMFYTCTDMGGDHYRGIGLGLFLCQSIVKAHDSVIDIEDNIPRGSVFTFNLKKGTDNVYE